MALDPTINLTSAARGAAGSTAIEGAVRARLTTNAEKRVSRAANSELPDRVWMVHGNPRVAIETEDYEEWLAALTGAAIVEILTLVYAAGSGSKTLTIAGAVEVGVNQLDVQPREGGGTVTRAEIEFEVVANGDNDTLAEALVVV